jgi:hypothetical protein
MRYLELYRKPGFGRRIRVVASVTGLGKIFGNLYTAVPEWWHSPPAPPPPAPPPAKKPPRIEPVDDGN